MTNEKISIALIIARVCAIVAMLWLTTMLIMNFTCWWNWIILAFFVWGAAIFYAIKGGRFYFLAIAWAAMGCMDIIFAIV